MDYYKNIDNREGNYSVTFNAVLDVQFNDPDPVIEPVTLEEALNHCLIDDLGQDNAIVEAFITTAREMCEDYTGVGFINRNVEAVVNNSAGSIYLPYGPVGEINEIMDIDENIIPDTDYKVTGPKFKQLSYPKRSWLSVNYEAGYIDLPKVLKTAILMQVAYLYEHRGDEQTGQFSPDAKALLNPHKRKW
jgi:uncharacterized phiE125 gp8 family phage protein